MLHNFGHSFADFAALVVVARKPEVNTAEMPLTNQERRHAVTSVSRKLRDARFRKNILTANGYTVRVSEV